MSTFGKLHETFIHSRRVRVLATQLESMVPPVGRMLDVGCGDGRVAAELARLRPEIVVTGIDVTVRQVTYIPVRAFDGRTIPEPDRSVDAVLLVDVLHHLEHPEGLLSEAHRVARRFVVIKDHCRNGLLAETTLRLMDWVGNARHGVALPYNYWSRAEWNRALSDEGLQPIAWRSNLGLYPWPLKTVFDRSLHFIAVLARSDQAVKR